MTHNNESNSPSHLLAGPSFHKIGLWDDLNCICLVSIQCSTQINLCEASFSKKAPTEITMHSESVADDFPPLLFNYDIFTF